MKSKLIIGLLSLVIAGYLCVKLALYLLIQSDNRIISTLRSPSKKYLLTEIVSETGPAPYGQYLVLSKKPVTTPEKGHIIFAGYCKGIKYSWESKDQIEIECKTHPDESKPVVTLSRIANGFSVNYEELR